VGSLRYYGATASDPPQAQAYRDIQGALDDAIERSIAANNPDDLGAFKEVRRQYGNFQDISKAASKLTGENAVAGTIPPSRVQTVLSSGNKAPGYAAGQGDLAELTRAGVGVLGPPAAPRLERPWQAVDGPCPARGRRRGSWRLPWRH
jgi:hypothetical protein